MPATTMITVAPLPATPEELVRTVGGCADIGAGVVHVGGDGDPARLTDTVVALREATDLVVRLSTGGSGADRLGALAADPDAAGCSLGDPWDDVVALHTALRDREIVPAYEIVEPGQLGVLARLLAEHGLPYGGHVHCELVMGGPGGLPGTLPALAAVLPALPPGATFSATGVGPSTLPVMLAALSAGGHLRVGRRDTGTYAPGEPVRADAQLVARAAGLARIAQRPPATVAETRALLGIRDRRPVRA